MRRTKWYADLWHEIGRLIIVRVMEAGGKIHSKAEAMDRENRHLSALCSLCSDLELICRSVPFIGV